MIVIVVLAVSAALGDVLLDPASGRIGAFARGFTAGALLVMVTDTCCRRPTTWTRSGSGAFVTIGIAISLMLSVI